MPVERSRGSRRTCADGIAFATSLTPGAFEESKQAISCMTAKFAVEPPSSLSPSPVEPKIEPATPGPTVFFFDAPPVESKPKRASHKSKLTPAPTTPCSLGSSDGRQQHIPRPPNAFILFRSCFVRAGAVPADVEPSHSSLSSIAGLIWAKLPAPEKELWHRKAKEEREKHRERFPGYAFRPRYRSGSWSDADSENSGGGGGGGNSGGQTQTSRRRQQREVAPADRIRQAHIASLLLVGLTGAALNEAIATFDAERRERGRGERPFIRRSTSKCKKRSRTASGANDGKRRQIDTSSAALSVSTLLSSPSTLTDTGMLTPSFLFDFGSLYSIPSTPIDDGFPPQGATPLSGSPPPPRHSNPLTLSPTPPHPPHSVRGAPSKTFRTPSLPSPPRTPTS
ncbi:HMG box domain-containing protein [Favolaschia claudopus]|uniref:HMG box domain-containing protein n=1 Tax=Favolaschia claudopus TaxID=2862362 RepID=A0AAV9ZSL1_9AGAR